MTTAGLVGLTGMFGGKLTFGPTYYDDAAKRLQLALNEAAEVASPVNIAIEGAEAAKDVNDVVDAVRAAGDGHNGAGPENTPTAGAPGIAPPVTTTRASDPAVAAVPAPDAPGQPRVRFASDIQPIFEASCVKCHGERKRKGGYRLDAREHALQPGDTENERPIIPGDSANSLLVKVIEGKGPYAEQKMPPEDVTLTGEQIALIRRWIDEGAEWN